MYARGSGWVSFNGQRGQGHGEDVPRASNRVDGGRWWWHTDLAKGVDIRSGNIVVIKPEKIWGGVVQYDRGKAEDGGRFVIKGQLNNNSTAESVSTGDLILPS